MRMPPFFPFFSPPFPSTLAWRTEPHAICDARMQEPEQKSSCFFSFFPPLFLFSCCCGSRRTSLCRRGRSQYTPSACTRLPFFGLLYFFSFFLLFPFLFPPPFLFVALRVGTYSEIRDDLLRERGIPFFPFCWPDRNLCAVYHGR